METLVLGPEVDAEAQVIVPRFIECHKPSERIWDSLLSDNSFSEDDRKCLGRIWYTKE